jgi:hypothetical protein
MRHHLAQNEFFIFLALLIKMGSFIEEFVLNFILLHTTLHGCRYYKRNVIMMIFISRLFTAVVMLSSPLLCPLSLFYRETHFTISV